MDLNESIRMDYTKWNFIIGIELVDEAIEGDGSS